MPVCRQRTVREGSPNMMTPKRFTSMPRAWWRDVCRVGPLLLTAGLIGSCGGGVEPTEITEIVITPAAPQVAEGETVTLSAQPKTASGANASATVTWSTSNPAVATVDAGGKVSGVGVGTATITAAITSPAVSQQVTVTVTTAGVASVEIVSGGVALQPAAFATLQVRILDKLGRVVNRPVTWGPGNGAIVAVDALGKVTGVSAGETAVTATSEGVSASVVAVVAVPLGGQVGPGGGTIGGTTGTNRIALLVPAGATTGLVAVQLDPVNETVDPRLRLPGSRFTVALADLLTQVPDVAVRYTSEAVPASVLPARLQVLEKHKGAWRPLTNIRVDPVAKTVTGAFKKLQKAANPAPSLLGNAEAVQTEVAVGLPSLEFQTPPASVQVGGAAVDVVVQLPAEGNRQINTTAGVIWDVTPDPTGGVTVQTISVSPQEIRGRITGTGAGNVLLEVSAELTVGTGTPGERFGTLPLALQVSPAPSGGLQLVVVGLNGPVVTAPSQLTVTGPNSFSQNVTTNTSQTLTSLPLGAYTVTAAAVTSGGTTFSVAPATQPVTIANGQTTNATVYYLGVVSPAALPGASVNQAYSTTLQAQGGAAAPYAWALATGSTLPAWLTLAANGVLSGTPPAAAAGTTLNFTAQVQSGTQTATKALTLQIQGGNGTVVGVVRNAVTNAVIAGATVRMGPSAGAFTTQSTTAADGSYTISNLTGDTYKVEATAAGFVTNTAANLQIVNLAAGDIARVDFALPPSSSTQPFGALNGRVTAASNAAPIGGASVTLDGGVATNGVFRSTNTLSDGTYSFAGVVLRDAQGNPLTTFTVRASAAGFVSQARSVVLTQNQVVTNVDFQLLAGGGGTTTYFTDGFETVTGWTATGFWNRSTLVGLNNKAYPTYVALAPDDQSGGALPAPRTGSFSFWYGQPAAGNFIGPQVSDDGPLSGGTSTTANEGLLTSPSIVIPAGASAASLQFDTWFEIESVNPNASGFDLMQVIVQDVGLGTFTTLARLNPFVDPTLPDRDAIPFTSAGFNLAPVWRSFSVNLDAYRGRTVRVQFNFSTEDALFNGFRGWIIDNVRVTEEAASIMEAGALKLPVPSAKRVRQPRRPRS